MFAAHYSSLLSFNSRSNSKAVPVLPDVIHSAFPNFCDRRGLGTHCPEELKWLATAGPDKFVSTTLALTLTFFILLPPSNLISLLKEFLSLYNVLVACRCITIIVTSLPSPSPMCRGVKTLSDLPKEGWFLAPVFCQDLLFSGHAILNVLCSCFLFQFPMIRSSPILKSLLLFYTTFSCFWSIILRDHYTVDVIVSTLLTLFLFLNKIEKVRYYAAGKLKVTRVKNILEGLCHIAILIVIGPVAFIVDKLKTMLYKPSKSKGFLLQTPIARFTSLKDFPFPPNYLTIKTASPKPFQVHYVDVKPKFAASQTILCLHGEPSWSYLYRGFVGPLVSKGYRVVLLDFNGFGKSDKFYNKDDYTHEMHKNTLIEFIQTLELKRFTMVVQDWGGLTGLSVIRDPNVSTLIRNLVIMNTGLPTGLDSYNVISALPFLIWRCAVVVLGSRLPVKIIFGCDLMRFRQLEGYSAPFPDYRFKAGVAKWPLLVPLRSTSEVAKDMKEARNFLRTFKKPVLMAFSDRDPITRGADKDIKSLFPSDGNVTSRVVEGGSHFLQDTHAGVICEYIIEFLEGNKSKVN
ncbi:hypothetical protein TL16_g07137 [Triparma laevis f. inornata]|uniref:AB hydrolase-1 domain-containing protein n=1 Tax=Triparma laevis f. inornata TaxID=1714386 RepID=A0A9W7AZ69_9STRA|nr:hypothetical protein TL16_g07137 [Triparma laevis f. inornata]